MDFRTAFDRLAAGITREHVAGEIGVSFHSVRQGLLPESSAAHRPPPPGWQAAVARLARRRAAELVKLADRLERT